ncbi:MAG: 1-acyl-sn-glycerol-3-phosphate acyltransferase [Dehalococcoidia bacterium]
MSETAAGVQGAAFLSLPGQESRIRVALRRSVTIPAYFIAFAILVIISPFLLLLGLLIDIPLRRRLATVRSTAMVDVFFFCEVAGTIASLWLWLRHRDRQRFLDANFALECWWASSLYRAGVWLFSLHLEVEGDDVTEHGPMMVFSRHVSPIDNLLPVALISDYRQIQLRWVINRSLLRDPCIDIVGNRLPNCFVANSSGDSEAEIRRVDALGRNLGPRDGVLIFPEGGLFTPARRERVLQRLEAQDSPLLERARTMTNVLPPRLGGSMALLAAARNVDAIFLAHTGLEGATEYRSILRGGLVGRTIRVKLWRVPASGIPTTNESRISWLFDQWAAVNEWVEANKSQVDA